MGVEKKKRKHAGDHVSHGKAARTASQESASLAAKKKKKGKRKAAKSAPKVEESENSDPEEEEEEEEEDSDALEDSDGEEEESDDDDDDDDDEEEEADMDTTADKKVPVLITKTNRRLKGPRYWCVGDGEILDQIIDMAEKGHEFDEFNVKAPWIDFKKINPEHPEVAATRWQDMVRKMSKKRTFMELAMASKRLFVGAQQVGRVLAVPEYNRKNKKKDPNRPKRPMNPYLLWAQKRRPKFSAKHPGKGYRDVTRLLGAEWATLAAAEKEKYEQRYKVMQMEYETKLAAYYETNPELKPADVEIDSNLPKRPPADGFRLFCHENRASTKLTKMTDQAKALSERWAKLDEANKTKFRERADELQANYEKEVQAYVDTLPEGERASLLKKLVKKKRIAAAKKSKASKTDTPKKPKLSAPVRPTAMKIFMEENRSAVVAENPGLPQNMINRKLRDIYKQLGTAEKDSYKAKEKIRVASYFTELQKYAATKAEDAQHSIEDGAAAADDGEDEAVTQVPGDVPAPATKQFQWVAKSLGGGNYVTMDVADQAICEAAYRKWKDNGKEGNLSVNVSFAGKALALDLPAMRLRSLASDKNLYKAKRTKSS